MYLFVYLWYNIFSSKRKERIEIVKLAKENKYIIKIDHRYLVGFEGKSSLGKTSHNGWNQQATEMGEVEFSMCQEDAKVIEGKINLKSSFDKLYDRMRYGNFEFNHLEILNMNSRE